jgi:hypothetical protein
VKDIHWIDSGQWPPAIAVTNSKRAYRKFLKAQCREHFSLCPPFPAPHGGLCQKLEAPGSCIFFIAVGEQNDRDELAATLAHEATHLMRWLFEHIGEKEPGTEAQAYLVEHVVRGGLKALAA